MSEVETLREIIRELIKLIDDGDLVRNTENDADLMKYMNQSTRIILVLRAAKAAAEKTP